MKLIRRKGKGDLPGSIYKPKYRDKDKNLVESQVYWVKYYKGGKPLRESTQTTEYDEAVTFLASRVADVTKGKTPNIKLNRVKFDDLCEDLFTDYRINGKRASIEPRSALHIWRSSLATSGQLILIPPKSVNTSRDD